MKEIRIPRVEVPMDRYFTANNEIYQETQAKIREKFGENSKAYKTIMNGINPENGTGSQFFFNNELNLHLPENQKVILLEDIERIYSQPIEFFDGSFYADTTELILRTEIPSWENNKHILEDLVKQIKGEKYEFSSENPLKISGLEQIKDENQDNHYGILLKIGKNTKITNDKRFTYNQNEIQLGNQTKTLYTKENGLSRVYLNWSDVLYAGDDSLVCSAVDGRVVIKEPKE